MITRIAENELKELARQFKAVAVTGPRQSGKTTLVRYVFPKHTYVSLENPDNRRFALEDPNGFLKMHNKGVIFDEIQKVPELFSYLQQILDEEKLPGQYILTGSNNFLLMNSISQSLAGRIGYLKLLPFSYTEIQHHGQLSLSQLMLKGFYPPVFDQPVDPVRWYANYINTYIERDVRQTIKVNNQVIFDRFIRLCAARAGQILNMNNLAIETGVDNKTIAHWLSILENSFILYRLKPYYNNFNKRIIKTPKLYFYDTGLVAHLLGIRKQEQLQHHPLWGSLFENLVMGEFLKSVYHNNLQVGLFFWRDNSGHEIDILLDSYQHLYPVEIKSGQTITSDYFKNLRFFQKLSSSPNGAVIYAGNQEQQRSDNLQVYPWQKIPFFLQSISS